MVDEVGKVIQGTDQEANAQTWREFLLRPENLSTALVLAAGLTSPRGRGQSKLGKVTQAGVGALAFRGGVEKNLASQQRQADLDEIAAAESAATIASGQALTRTQQRANDISSRQVDQLGQARPLNPSEKARNEAQAAQARGAGALSAAQAKLLGVEAKRESSTFQRLLITEQEKAAIGGEKVDFAKIGELASRAAMIDITESLFDQGKITPSGLLTLTPEDVTALKAVGIDVPDIDKDDDSTDDTTDGTTTGAGPATSFEAIQAEIVTERERVGGLSSVPSLSGFTTRPGGIAAVDKLKRQGKFSDVSDEEIEAALARAIQSIRNGAIKSMTLSELVEIRRTFGSVLSRKDTQELRFVTGSKLGAPLRSTN